MKIDKKIIYVASAICISLGLFAFTMQKTAKQTVALHYSDDYLKEKEKAIWSKLNKIGATEDEFKKRCQEYRLQLEQEPKPAASIISPAVKERLIEILRTLNMDITEFTLVHFDDYSPVAYAQNVIFINESRFNELPELAQAFAVAHEMQHKYFQDDISISIMQDWMQELSGQYPEALELFNEYSRFIEERADVMTALIDEEFAQGYIIFFQTRLKQSGDNPGLTHPKHSYRLQLAQQIYADQQGALV